MIDRMLQSERVLGRRCVWRKEVPGMFVSRLCVRYECVNMDG